MARPLSWMIGVSCPGTGTVDTVDSQRGDQPEPYHADGDNGLHAIDINVDFDALDPVPPGGRVKIYLRVVLTRWNTIRWDDPTWTHTVPPGSDAGPNDGIEIADPVWISGNVYKHVLTIYNDDNNGTSEAMTVTGLRWGTVPDFAQIDDPNLLANFSNYGATQPDFNLDPNESMAFDIQTDGPLLGGGIVVDYTLDSGRATVGQDLTGHEVTDSPPIPTVSEWGLIVTTLLLFTGVTIVVRHQRRLRTTPASA